MVQIETSGAVRHPGISASVLDVATVVCSPKTSKINRGLIPYADALSTWMRRVKWIGIGMDMPSGGRTTGGQESCSSEWPEIRVDPIGTGIPDLYTANLDISINVRKHFGYRLNVQLHKYIQVP